MSHAHHRPQYYRLTYGSGGHVWSRRMERQYARHRRLLRRGILASALELLSVRRGSS